VRIGEKRGVLQTATGGLDSWLAYATIASQHAQTEIWNLPVAEGFNDPGLLSRLWGVPFCFMPKTTFKDD